MVDYTILGLAVHFLEIARNYEQALVDAGYTMLFKCHGRSKTCGWPKFDPLFGEFPYSDEHYLIARATDKATSEVLTVAVRSLRNPTITVFLVRSKAMDTGMAKVDAAAMSKGIEQTGHMACHGLQFDTGKSTLNPGICARAFRSGGTAQERAS